MSKEIKQKFKKADVEIAIVGEDLITFKETNVIKVEILKMKDGIAKISGKDKKQYEMRVKDLIDDKEKNFNVASARLRKLLSDINESEGIIGQKLRIEKIGAGMGTQYQVDKIV